MAGANGPTSLGGTPDTPNPMGGAEPSEKARQDAERKEAENSEPPQDKPSQDQNEDG